MRESTLINRFTAGVCDEALQRELRRLKVVRPELTFWEFRKRAIDCMGKSPAKLNKAASAKKVVVSEAHVVNKENDLSQFSQLSAKVDDMMKLMQGFMSSRGRNGNNSSGRGRGNVNQTRRCYRCHSADHGLQRNRSVQTMTKNLSR
jgi:hypothetical protein